MPQDWSQLGITGIFAVLVLKMAFDFVAQWKGRQNGFSKVNWLELARQVSELHKMHDKTDSDGVPVWYVRKSLEDAMSRLADNIEKQTDVSRKQTEVLQTLVRDVGQVYERVTG